MTRAELILNSVKDKLDKNNLILAKKSGKIELTVEMNISQGSISSASVIDSSKESISFDVKK